MNYTLTINLEGDEAVNAQLAKLLDGMNKISSNKPEISFEEWLNAGDIEGAGVDAGESLGEAVKKGVKKSLTSFGGGIAQIMNGPNVMKELESQIDAMLKVSPEAKLERMRQKSDEKFAKQQQREGEKSMAWWNKAIWRGIKDELKQPMQGPDLSGDLRKKFWKHTAPDEPGGRDLAKVQALPDINDVMKSLEPGKFDLKKFLMGASTAAFNPWIGSRLMSDAIPKPPSGGGGNVAAGIFGAGGAMGFGEFYIAIQVFRKAVDIFKSLIFSAMAKADKLYSSALQSGLGLRFTEKRSELAKIMGVSEQDIFRFGNQIAYLNPKIEQAVRVISNTSIPLTQMSWNFKILALDFQALIAEIVTGMTPALNNFIAGIDHLVKFLVDNYSRIQKLNLLLNPEAAGLKLVMDLFQKKYAEANPANMPSPQAWMKQLPGSTWEKMGLQIAGGATNYARETAKNTQSIAKDIKIVAKGFQSAFMNTGGGWNMLPTGNHL